MLSYQITPGATLQGEISVPGDKSMTHRALIFAALANGVSTIRDGLMGEDNQATLSALNQLGVVSRFIDEHHLQIHGVGTQGLSASKRELDLKNSGTGLRLLCGVLAGQNFPSELSGDTSLRRRPMQRIVEPLTQMGARIEASADGTPPLHIIGNPNLQAIDYEMPIASAQVKSALLLAGLNADGVLRITELAPSRDHSERMLQQFGVTLTNNDGIITMAGRQRLQVCDINIAGDLSSAAFFIVAACITPGADIMLRNVGINPTRTGVITILQQMGADIALSNQRLLGTEPVADIRVRYTQLQGVDIAPELVPLAIDEFPIIFIAAALAKGRTRVQGAVELRHKESDRLAAMAQGLTQLGCRCELLDDGIEIEGGSLFGGTIESHGDHRIAMAFAIAANRASDVIQVMDCVNVATSFPNFVVTARQLGMQIRESS